MTEFSVPEGANEWTVLIVDDDPDNLGVPVGVLEYYGAQVHTARDGMQGLNIFKSLAPTFVLLDLSMPNVDGWQMLEEIRATPSVSSIPVIALTAHAMEGDRQRALDAGFDGYIAKPFLLQTFLNEITQCLTKPEQI